MDKRTAPVKRAMSALGEQTAFMRRITHMTAKTTAARAGVSLMTLRKFERGENVELASALEILRAVGLLEQVVEGADPLNSEQGRARLAAYMRKSR
ncbi:hypothetical protein [Gulosibacter sp. 10]|uniref:hypothetical protein n=1 Tax=Gulosibacter sp. 10 TaxID=1255570 RepID=UPI00097F0BAE|nr:hypothetical protein [Gulosibacter sp. 10]SJM69123.1 hypothetical protein FM112_13970 [Gulosibacter sp. 10]